MFIATNSSEFFFGEMAHVDGRIVDFNGMAIVAVKCFDYGWTNGCESD